jgi:hypothetical protein
MNNALQTITLFNSVLNKTDYFSVWVEFYKTVTFCLAIPFEHNKRQMRRKKMRKKNWKWKIYNENKNHLKINEHFKCSFIYQYIHERCKCYSAKIKMLCFRKDIKKPNCYNITLLFWQRNIYTSHEYIGK